MLTTLEQSNFLWKLFKELRRRHFPLGMRDYVDLHRALRGGFGWSSHEDMRDLCCMLWAKSPREQEIVASLFTQLAPDEWNLETPETPEVDEAGAVTEPPTPMPQEQTLNMEPRKAPIVQPQGGLPPISIPQEQITGRSLILVPQFALGYREIAQAWRRLRRPVRQGPNVDLDINATIDLRARLGVPSPAVLVPRRRNTARALLLVDRQGSMAPFHYFVDEVTLAIMQASRLESVEVFYFHDVPVEAQDKSVLRSLYDGLFPVLDPVLAEIKPDIDGIVFADRDLTTPLPLAKVLRQHASGASVVIVSDAGAARRRYDLVRLINTIAFVKGLRTYTTEYVWLNPLPHSYWKSSTAEQIARHVPMLTLDRSGLYRAVNLLRGQPFHVERPI